MNRKRSIIIIEAQYQDVANQAATGIVPNPADVTTFTSPLSADGLELATHFICSVVLIDEQRSAVMAAMAAAAPSAMWWRLDGPDPFEGKLLETNVSASQLRIGQVFTAEDALSDVGLQFIKGVSDV